ncbi:hypothetical protein OG422_30555 [Streptomyces sp. NBC_01525]|uniref:hypothetical protein n=1 Tax=Streptomyces sp. NBC_01525 TaxID=2903893 RepID=UPI00386E66A5
MKHLLDKIETRQKLVRETAGQLREQITGLSVQLATAERTLERLEITRETLLELAAEDNAEPPEPLPPGYPEIRGRLRGGHGRTPRQGPLQSPGHRYRAAPRRDHAGQAETPGQPRHPRRTEPGLFTPAQPAPAASDPNPA